VHATNAAITAGLTVGVVYHTGNGIVRVVKAPQPPKGEFEKLYYKNLKGLRVLAPQPPKGEFERLFLFNLYLF
jgi:hypothetical protein